MHALASVEGICRYVLCFHCISTPSLCVKLIICIPKTYCFFANQQLFTQNLINRRKIQKNSGNYLYFNIDNDCWDESEDRAYLQMYNWNSFWWWSFFTLAQNSCSLLPRTLDFLQLLSFKGLFDFIVPLLGYQCIGPFILRAEVQQLLVQWTQSVPKRKGRLFFWSTWSIIDLGYGRLGFRNAAEEAPAWGEM